MEQSSAHDDWKATPHGRYLAGRMEGLILGLSAPQAGERLLDIGCGSGEQLSLFRRKGCDVTGVDSSHRLLDLADRKLRNRAELHRGPAEDLPFCDNEFDIVTLIASLEFTDDPGLALAEAVRVCRGRVFIGTLNRFSAIGLQGRLMGLFDPPSDREARFIGLSRINTLLRNQSQGIRPRWGSVLFLPWGWYGFGAGLEEKIPVMKNPCGAFLGLAFPVTFPLRTIQETIRETAALGAEGQRPMPGIVRESKHGP
jgi:SAM-dependent methyltransferase